MFDEQEIEVQFSLAVMASGMLLPAPSALPARIRDGSNAVFLVSVAGVTPFAAQEQDKARKLEQKWTKETENLLSKSSTAALCQISLTLSVN